MIKQLKLSDLIREKILLKPSPTSKWESCKCQVCNDYQERGGFLLTDDEVVYNCFNCPATTARYKEHSGKISDNFRKILNSFGIDDTEINASVSTGFFQREKVEKKITLAILKKINTVTPDTKLPPKSFPLGHPEFLDYQEKLVAYLLERKIDINKYPFFFSLERRFINRIIIPFYRQGSLIYWQARSINKQDKKRYDNSPVTREAVMFNFDQLNMDSKLPLFITEGVFDAMMVDGVSIIGSKLSAAKIKLLSASHRRLIFVIDKDDNGRHLAQEALNHGWEIAFSPDGTEDLNQSVQRFGLSWTIYELMKSIRKDRDKAQNLINVYCKSKN